MNDNFLLLYYDVVTWRNFIHCRNTIIYQITVDLGLSANPAGSSYQVIRHLVISYANDAMPTLEVKTFQLIHTYKFIKFAYSYLQLHFLFLPL